MNILLANNYARTTGGADKHTMELARGLAARGHTVNMVATAHPANEWSRGAFVPTTVTRQTRDAVTGISAARTAALAMWNRRAATAVAAMCGQGVDVVHVHKLYPQLSVAPVVIAARHKVPIVQTVHDYEFVSASAWDSSGRRIDHEEDQVRYRALNSGLFAAKRLVHVPRVTRWIAVSRATAAVYSEHGIVAEVMPNFVETSAAPRRRYRDRDGVVFLGRVSAEKGIRDLLAVAGSIPALSITIAGTGDLVSTVEAAAVHNSSIRYVGLLDRDAAMEYLSRARIAVMPSLWDEPGPLAALEAMAVGTPVVAYASGGLAEYVIDAAGGVVVPRDPEALADALWSLHEDARRWDELSSAASKSIHLHNGIDTYLDRLERVYVDAIGGAVAT